MQWCDVSPIRRFEEYKPYLVNVYQCVCVCIVHYIQHVCNVEYILHTDTLEGTIAFTWLQGVIVTLLSLWRPLC